MQLSPTLTQKLCITRYKDDGYYNDKKVYDHGYDGYGGGYGHDHGYGGGYGGYGHGGYH